MQIFIFRDDSNPFSRNNTFSGIKPRHNKKKIKDLGKIYKRICFVGKISSSASQPRPEAHLSRLIVLQLKFEHSLTLLFLYSNFRHAIRLRDNFHHVKPKKKWGNSVFLFVSFNFFSKSPRTRNASLNINWAFWRKKTKGEDKVKSEALSRKVVQRLNI